MKIIIAGSRSIQSFELLEKATTQAAVKGWFIDKPIEIVSGCCRGPDKLGEQWAKQAGFKITPMPAEWNKYGKRAGPIRNKAMAEYADAAIVLWDGVSNGSKNMIDEMHRLGKPVIVVKP